jgi:arginase
VAGRIARQINKVILIGAPTSAGAANSGVEKAPERLRAAGLAASLRDAGFDVSDLGDTPVIPFQPDDENPRARNIRNVLRAVESLRPMVEQAVRTGGLPVILGGDTTIVLGALAGLRRYYRTLSLFYMDRDPSLNIPATSPSGFLDGMAVAHAAGRGAAEMMRFYFSGEPPLVREPEIAIFGIARLDPAEQEWLWRSPLHGHKAEKIANRMPSEAAMAALEEIHGHQHEFLLHLDASVISQDDIAGADHPGTGGLGLAYVREAVTALATEPHLAAMNLTGYNPERDADGSGAKILVALITGALKARLASAPKSELKTETKTETETETKNKTASDTSGDSKNETTAESVVIETAPSDSPGSSSGDTESVPNAADSLQEASGEKIPCGFSEGDQQAAAAGDDSSSVEAMPETESVTAPDGAASPTRGSAPSSRSGLASAPSSLSDEE